MVGIVVVVVFVGFVPETTNGGQKLVDVGLDAGVVVLVLPVGVFVVDVLLGVAHGVRGIVIGRVGGLSAGAELILDGSLAELNDDREYGNTDHHTDEAEEAAHHDDGHQNGQRADTGVVALDDGAEDVAVELYDARGRACGQERLASGMRRIAIPSAGYAVFRRLSE